MKHSRSKTLLALLAAGSLALLHAASTANAGVVLTSWTGADDDVFGNDLNWTGGAPDADTDAEFDGVVDTITFTGNAFSLNLFVIDGSSVEFQLDGNTYAVTDTILIDDSTLAIFDGTLSAATVIINNQGLLTVGLDATLNVTGGATLIVGDDDEGTLEIEDGGTVSADSMIVGNQMGGDGYVDIQEGGTLNTGSAILGNEDGSVGWVDVEGTWNNDGSIVVGNEGSGTVIMFDGGSIDTGSLVVANMDGGVGYVELVDGATIDSGSAIIGNDDGSDGYVFFDGGGEWNNTGAMIVGNAGIGVLDIDGGMVSTGTLAVGNEETGDGNVWVYNDAVLNSNSAVVAATDGADGYVEVSFGGTWNNAGNLTVGALEGDHAGSAGVDVFANSMLHTGNLAVGNAGVVMQIGNGLIFITDDVQAIAAFDGDFAALAASLGLEPGQEAILEAALTAGGIFVTNNSLTIVNGGEVHGVQAFIDNLGTGGAASAIVSGEGSLLDLDGGDLVVGWVGNASLTIDDGGKVESGDAFIGDDEGSSGSVTVSGQDENDNASEWAITGDLNVGVEGDGSLTVEGGALVSATGDAFIGTVDGGSGSVTVTGEDSLLDVTGSIDVGNSDAALGEAAAAGDVNAMLSVLDGAEIIAGGGITVNETGLLMGDGLITGDVNVFGRLAPGASIGTLNITGTLDMQPGSILQVEYDNVPLTEADLLELFPTLDPEDVGNLLASDVVAVTGQVTFEDGTQIQVVKLTGGPVPGDSIIIVWSETGITADPDELEIQGTFLVGWTAEVIMSGGDEFLLLTAEFDQDAFDEFIGALSGNLLRVATALSEGELFELLGALDPEDPQAGLLSLLPLHHGTAAMQSIRTSQIFNRSFMHEMAAHRSGLGGIALNGGGSGMIADSATNPTALAQAVKSLDRAEDPDSIAFGALQQAGSWGGFIRGMGVWDRVNSDGANRIGHRARVWGVHGGVHNHVSNEFLLGLSLGYLNSDLDFRGGFGEGEIHTVRVGPYLSWAPGGGDLFVDASATYGYHRNEIERETITGTARSRYDAHDISILGQVGHDFVVFDRTILTPMAGVEFTHLRTDSFRERGAGAANLAVSSQSTDSLRLRLGAKLAHAIDMVGLTIVPEVYAGWAHEFLDRDVDVRSRFLAGGGNFTTRTAGVGRDAAQVSAGISALLDPNMAFFIRYEGEFQSGRRSHGVVGGLNLNF